MGQVKFTGVCSSATIGSPKHSIRNLNIRRSLLESSLLFGQLLVLQLDLCFEAVNFLLHVRDGGILFLQQLWVLSSISDSQRQVEASQRSTEAC